MNPAVMTPGARELRLDTGARMAIRLGRRRPVAAPARPKLGPLERWLAWRWSVLTSPLLVLALWIIATALELAPERIRVNAVAPGPVATGLHHKSGLTPAQVDQLLASRAQTIPLRRVGTPLETARWVARLALDDEWVTGAIIPVDGGMSVG